MANQPLETVYQQLCESYRAIDDMRTKLLGALPLATGTGIFLLLNKDPANLVSQYSLPIGVFGFLVTLGLAAYELYGIKKCTALIQTGKHIENQLQVPGQFVTRPEGLLGFISEPLAGGFIYPAVLASWVFVALHNSPACGCVALLVFSLGLVFSIGYKGTLRDWHSPELKEWIRNNPQSGPPGDKGGQS